MVFSSAPFLFFFLPVVWILHSLVKNRTLQNVILVVASLLFYAYGEPSFVLVMVASVVVNYLFAIGISKDGKHKKLFLVFCVVFNMAMIGVFKYTG
ncbi:MAG: MBOAT family protein, partial [Lachnospiraceae bacterium]|nr:MBOAT family protein [Lachnospiraceae bacterium]